MGDLPQELDAGGLGAPQPLPQGVDGTGQLGELALPGDLHADVPPPLRQSPGSGSAGLDGPGQAHGEPPPQGDGDDECQRGTQLEGGGDGVEELLTGRGGCPGTTSCVACPSGMALVGEDGWSHEAHRQEGQDGGHDGHERVAGHEVGTQGPQHGASRKR